MHCVPCLLDDRFAVEIDIGNLERRIAKVEAIRSPAMNLAHADLAYPGIAERQGFLHRADHHDFARMPRSQRRRRRS
jgi:hypothetical protein